MKSLMLLWQEVLRDRGTWCRTDTNRDLKTVTARVKDEGLSFLTITLTNFGKDFERSLDQGFVGSDQFAGFSRTGGLPKFLSGFLRQIFDPDGCGLLPDPSIDAIQAVRQLTLMYGKIQIPCSEARNRKAVDGYVQCEMDVREANRRLGQSEKDRLRRVFALCFGRIFETLEEDISRGKYEYLLPKHGPGATADRLAGNQKFLAESWTERLDRVLGVEEFLLANYRFVGELHSPGRYPIHDPGAEQPVRVTLVPKTLKTPRIIAMEPTCMQYAQQAILGAITTLWKRDDLLPQFISFDDQEPNKVLARKGSRDGSLATLDLSEASDRVSNQLVQHVLSWWPSFAEAVDACRSRTADVPFGHGVIQLEKFASMGSALTFPIESMVFLAIIFYSIEEAKGHTLTRRDLKQLVGSVRVFGDDLIIPEEHVRRVISNLELFGFKVNAGKSFWNGKFRESCGGDFYDGHDVSIVRCRRMLPTSRTNAEEVISIVSLRNQFYSAGYWEACKWIDAYIVNTVRYFPIVASTSPVIGRHSFLPPEGERMCDRLHRPLVKGYVVEARPPLNRLDGHAALLKFFLLRGEEPLDEGHLERSGRPRTVRIKARWNSLA